MEAVQNYTAPQETSAPQTSAPPQSSAAPEKIKIGPDQVEIVGNQVIIDARHIFPDWQVREHSRIPIYFRDQKYFLRQKADAQKPYAIRYVLERWPDDLRETSRLSLDYGEEAVSDREAAIRGGHFDDVGRAAFLLFFPVVGMLWSRTKDKLARFGVVPRTVTGISIMVTFGLVLLEGVFAKMLLMGSLKTGHVVVGGMLRTFASQDYWHIGPIAVRILWLDVALFILLVLDVLIRYSHHLYDNGYNPGFLEWMFRKKRNPAQETPVD
jgi:hypothetical protein